VREGKFGLANTNKLLKSYPGATGLKTGSTDEALFCLSATAEREGTGLIAVLMGCPTSKERFADAATLLNYGFANFTSLPVTTDEPIPTVPVTLGEMDYVHGELKAVDPLLMEKADTAAVTRTLTMEPGLTAPVEEGQQIGKLTLSLNGKQVAEAPVIASHGVARLGVSQIFSRLFRIIGMRTTA